MKLTFYLNTLLILFVLISCKSTESDIVENQSQIYAEYEIVANIGSKKVVATTTFYEETNGFFYEYIAKQTTARIHRAFPHRMIHRLKSLRNMGCKSLFIELTYDKNFHLFNNL